jgi:hypothetical protein
MIPGTSFSCRFAAQEKEAKRTPPIMNDFFCRIKLKSEYYYLSYTSNKPNLKSNYVLNFIPIFNCCILLAKTKLITQWENFQNE